MYKHHLIFSICVFIGCFLLSFMAECRLHPGVISDLITFFSIVFGFYLTALSILYGSNFTKRLGSEEDPRKKTQTKLQTLMAYFGASSFISISAIVILLIVNLLKITEKTSPFASQCRGIFTVSICTPNILTALALGLAAVNIIFMSFLFKIFFNAFLEEGTNNA